VAGALAVAPFASAAQNACKLVTAADASSALKGTVDKGKHLKIGTFNACVYTLKKVTVTVKTRLLSRSAYAQVVKRIPGTSLKASDISDTAWVYFVTDGTGLEDWKQGNEINLVVTGAGADAVLILKALGKDARGAV